MRLTVLPVALLCVSSWAHAQEPRNLTSHPAEESAIAWSPNSDALLVSSDRGDDADIYRIELSDGHVSPVRVAPGDDYVAAWSADGQVLFVSTVDDNPEIFRMAIDGTGVAAVQPDPANDWWPSRGVGGAIFFNTYRYGGSSELVVLEPDGETLRRLTVDEHYDAAARPAPDGARLLFHSLRGENYDLYLMRLDDGSVERLTAHPGDDSYGSWSPDGRRVAFRSARDGNDEIYVIEIETGYLHRVTDHEATDSYPAWSPDGRWIAFLSDRTGDTDVFVVAAPPFSSGGLVPR